MGADDQSWLIPVGADGGEFRMEVRFLRSIITPLREAVSDAKEIRDGSWDDELALLADTAKAAGGSEEISQAVDHFMGKWGHGLKAISDEAGTIADNLQATVNDFLATETKAAYDMLMARREREAEAAGGPVTSFVNDHITEPLNIDKLPSPPSLGDVTEGWFD